MISEEAKLAEERAKYADEIKKDLEKIEKSRTCEEFLEWVYGEYPPRLDWFQFNFLCFLLGNFFMLSKTI